MWQKSFIFFQMYYLVPELNWNHALQCAKNKAILRKVELWLDTNDKFV